MDTLRTEIHKTGRFRFIWEIRDTRYSPGFVFKVGFARTRWGAERKARRYVLKEMDRRMLRHIEKRKDRDV